MSESDYKKVIENVNYDYLNSKEYQIGSYICYLKKLLSKRKYNQIFKLVINHFTKSKTKTVNTVYNESLKPIKLKQKINKKKIAVYTCITGNYDNVNIPYMFEENCDYILFTNNPKLKSDFWTIKSIPSDILKLEDNILINRYIKMHPHEVLNEYDLTIYIDGNIKIVSDLSCFCSNINKITGLAIHTHNKSISLYDELKECKAYSKGNYSKLKKQVDNYISGGFPINFGVYECNMIIADIKNEITCNLLNNWWDEFISTDSKRDQFSLPYVIWKNGFNYEDVGCIGKNINLNSHVKIINHN